VSDTRSLKIAFMGTPDFALPGLKILLGSRHQVEAVITAPDKPAGRGKKLRSSPVKLLAQEAGIAILQPEALKDPGFVEQLRALKADIFLVVAFRVLPAEVFTLPPLGTINLHASLLPRYRGAAPINWAIINGETTTGVTTFFIEEKIDTGKILQQRQVPIPPEMTAGELHDILAAAGAELLLETVDGIAKGTLHPIVQEGKVTLAPKLTPDLERIDWSKNALEVHNLIHGLSPFPGCHTFHNGRRLKVIRSRVSEINPAASTISGQVVAVDRKGSIDVQTGSGALSLLELQAEGKRAMCTAEFLRGYEINVGDVFEKFKKD
jgi:methionyl-tRNA formyltransferase